MIVDLSTIGPDFAADVATDVATDVQTLVGGHSGDIRQPDGRNAISAESCDVLRPS